jgi:ABC-type cobalamin/Fe3+-siderophores transport system ATPase subunit
MVTTDGREHGAKTMARICLNPLTTRDGAVLAVDAFTGTRQPGRITGFRGPNGAGTTTTLRMPVELTRPKPATPLIDRHIHLRSAQPSPAMAAMTDSAVSHARRSGPDTPRGRENSSPAISRPVTRLGLAATAVLIVVVAVAAAFCAAHGWSHTVQQLAHALRHLPQPLRTLVGGSSLTHLLN